MREDPIVEEVRRAREAYASRFDFDLEALVENLKRQQAESDRQVVTRKPRKPADRGSIAAFQVLILLTPLLALPAPLSGDTWSIIAVDRRTGEIGIAAASCTNNVQGIGSIVPGIGIVVVQAMSSNEARTRGTELLRSGATPEEIIRVLRDPSFDPENQQYGVAVLSGNHPPATYSGTLTSEWSGSAAGDGVSVQGNILVGEAVLVDALAAFQAAADETLSERLMAALVAGAQAGGDRRCGEQRATSAHLTVYKRHDAEGAPYVHIGVYGIEKGGQPAVAVLSDAFDEWLRERSHQRSTRLYFVP